MHSKVVCIFVLAAFIVCVLSTTTPDGVNNKRKFVPSTAAYCSNGTLSGSWQGNAWFTSTLSLMSNGNGLVSQGAQNWSVNWGSNGKIMSFQFVTSPFAYYLGYLLSAHSHEISGTMAAPSTFNCGNFTLQIDLTGCLDSC